MPPARRDDVGGGTEGGGIEKVPPDNRNGVREHHEGMLMPCSQTSAVPRRRCPGASAHSAGVYAPARRLGARPLMLPWCTPTPRG